MFPRLAELVGPARRVLDIGCGFATPAAWLLAARPEMRFHCLEPDPRRAAVAAWVLGSAGVVQVGAAPRLPASPWPPEAVLFLDVAHYLDDQGLLDTLQAVRARLAPGGRLVLRATVPGGSRQRWQRWLERSRLFMRRQPSHYRPAGELRRLIAHSGFSLLLEEPTAPGREETWFVAQAREA